jgi:hypothetical protein
MIPECPNLIHPRLYVNHLTDEDYEGTAMCAEADKSCPVYYDSSCECETYQEWLKEEENEAVINSEISKSMADEEAYDKYQFEQQQQEGER